VNDSASLNDHNILMNRAPVFDRESNIQGYELSLHEDDSTPAGAAEQLSELLRTFEEELSQDKQILLGIDGRLGAMALSNATERHVIALRPDASTEELAAAKRLRDSGAKIMLHYRPGIHEADSLLADADIIRLSIRNRSPREVMAAQKELKNVPGMRMAADIDSWEAFEGTRALGFQWFHGPFFTRPYFSPGEPVKTGAVAKLQVLRELNMPDCDLIRLSEAISTDVGLSYRLLSYINSAAFSLPNKIKSIQQAVALLGLEETKKWAMVVLMSGLDESDKGSELAFMALQHARFLEDMASLESVPHSPGTMFLLGLFSRLDALLSHPMPQLLERLPLDDEIKLALCGRESPLRSWLRMLDAVQREDWKKANEILCGYGACLPQAAASYLRASTWANRQCSAMSCAHASEEESDTTH